MAGVRTRLRLVGTAAVLIVTLMSAAAQAAPGIADPGFETGTSWDIASSEVFPASSGWRGTYAIGRPHSGVYAQTLSNRAVGTVSQTVAVSGTPLQAAVWVRGRATGEEGSWAVRVRWLRSGSELATSDVATSGTIALTDTWQSGQAALQPPPSATHATFEISVSMFDGWLAVDDATLASSHGNLLVNAGFETDDASWKVSKARDFPATAAWVGTYSIGEGRTGRAQTLSNTAHATVSQTFDAIPGAVYTLAAHARAAISDGYWAVRADAVNDAGSVIGRYTAIGSESPVGPDEWAEGAVKFTTPAGTVGLRVEVAARFIDGWFTVDELTLRRGGVAVLSNGGFESADAWAVDVSTLFPGTSWWRGTYSIGTPLAGRHGLTISNVGFATVSQDVDVAGADDVRVGTWLRGEVTFGEWAFAVDARDADGDVLATTNVAHLHDTTVGTSWQSPEASLRLPAGTTTLTVRLMANFLDGWLAIDDVFLRYAEASGDTARLEGQRSESGGQNVQPAGPTSSPAPSHRTSGPGGGGGLGAPGGEVPEPRWDAPGFASPEPGPSDPPEPGPSASSDPDERYEAPTAVEPERPTPPDHEGESSRWRFAGIPILLGALAWVGERFTTEAERARLRDVVLRRRPPDAPG